MSIFRTADNLYPDHLLQKNQEVTAQNVALYKAASAGSLAGVSKALENGAKPNFFFNPEDGKNSLHIASENNFPAVVELLLKEGSVVDCISGPTQNTALHFACASDASACVSILLNAGANINQLNCYGNSPMHEAINCCSEETIAILFSNEKLNINVANKKGSRLIHIACYNNSIKDSPLSNVKKLVERGADVNCLDLRGASPLLVCCASGREDIITYLIEHGADPTCKNSSNQSAYDVCAFHNHEELGMKLFGPDSPSKRFSAF